MGEKLDTVFFFDNACDLPPRHAIVELLSAHLSREPVTWQEWFVLDYENNRETSGALPDEDVFLHPLSRSEILFLYSSAVNFVPPVILSIVERDNTAVYTLAIEMSEVFRHPITVYEEWLGDVFRKLSSFGLQISFAGSESGCQEDWNTASIVRDQAFSPTTHSYWIAVCDDLLPSSFIDFDIAVKADRFCVLRHRLCLEYYVI